MNGKTYFLENGTILDDRYVLREVIGEGGFGITYAGENERIGLKVAIKEFFCRDYMGRNCAESNTIYLTDNSASDRFEKEKARFLKEARILSDFSSEKGIVHVNDYFEDNGTAYIVMSYLTGTTLKDYVKQNGPMEAELLFSRIKPLMKTLGRVHQAGLIHRDISPDNIMMLEDGAFCLIDFGAAMVYNAAEKSFTMICKRSYAAPEMYNRKGELDPRADIYSLSATLYYCLTGKDPEDSLQRILMDEIESANRLNPAVTAETEKMLTKGLSLHADDRFQDIPEYLSAIEVLYPEQTEAPQKKISKKAIALIVIAAAIIVSIVVGLLLYLPHRTELRFKNIDTEVVWLYMDEDMSAQDYNYSKEIVKDRLEILAGKNNYLWEEQEDKIRMEFPVSQLEGHNPASMTRAYLSRPYDLYLAKENKGQLEQVQADAVAIAREDLVKVELLTGEIEGIEREKFKLPETGDYRYFKITLSDNAAQSFNDKYDNILTRKNEDFFLFYDLFIKNASEYFYNFCVSCGDGKSFYLINYDLEGNYLDVLNYTLTHPASNAGFSVSAEPVVDWEKRENSWTFGENQVNEAEITGQYYLLQYSFYSTSKEKKAAWAHNMIAFKERLDALQIPYAFGLLEYDNRTFVLKLQKEGLFREIVDTLGDYYNKGIDLQTKWESVTYVCSEDELSFNKENQTLSAILYEHKIPAVKEFATGALAKGDQTAYLYSNNIPIAKILLTELINATETGEVETADLLFDPESRFWDFLTVCSREDVEGIGGRLEEISLKDESDGSFTSISVNDLPNMLETIYPDDVQIRSDMKRFAEDNGCIVTFDTCRTGVNVKFWIFDENKKSIIADLTSFAEKYFTEFEKPTAKGDIYSSIIWFDLNEPYNNKQERIGLSFGKSDDSRTIELQTIYINNLDLDSDKVKKEVLKAFRTSSVLKNRIDTAKAEVY